MMGGPQELTKRNYAKVQLRLDSSLPTDVHRSFIAHYYPKTRSIQVAEVRTVVTTVKLLTIFPEATYLKPNGDTYLLEDLEVGCKLEMGTLPGQKDRGATKAFVVTELDTTYVSAINYPEEAQTRPKTVSRSDIEELRAKFNSQFDATSIQKLGHAFVADRSGQRKASSQQLFRAFEALDAGWSQEDITDMVSCLDTNQDGLLSYEEFMYICRGSMSETRRQCVRKAFAKVDYNKSGSITEEEVRLFYNISYDPMLQTGQKSEEEVYQGFLSTVDTNGNGFITWEEFEDHYNGISATIERDEDFLTMMQRYWNLDNRNMNGVSFH